MTPITRNNLKEKHVGKKLADRSSQKVLDDYTSAWNYTTKGDLERTVHVQKKRKQTAYSLWKEEQNKIFLGKGEKGIHSFAKNGVI